MENVLFDQSSLKKMKGKFWYIDFPVSARRDYAVIGVGAERRLSLGRKQGLFLSGWGGVQNIEKGGNDRNRWQRGEGERGDRVGHGVDSTDMVLSDMRTGLGTHIPNSQLSILVKLSFTSCGQQNSSKPKSCFVASAPPKSKSVQTN